MRIIHGDGFKDKEREEAKEIVLSNLVICIYLVISQMDLDPVEDEDSWRLLQLADSLHPHLSAREEKEISQYVIDMIQSCPDVDSNKDDKHMDFSDRLSGLLTFNLKHIFSSSVHCCTRFVHCIQGNCTRK